LLHFAAYRPYYRPDGSRSLQLTTEAYGFVYCVLVLVLWAMDRWWSPLHHHMLLATARGRAGALVWYLHDKQLFVLKHREPQHSIFTHTLGTTQLGALGMCAKTCKRCIPGCIASMPNHGTGSRGSHACSLPHPGL